MIWVALGALLLGFILVTPRGATPGSAAHRNVAMGSHFFQTPGYQQRESTWNSRRRVALGLFFLAVAAVLLFITV